MVFVFVGKRPKHRRSLATSSGTGTAWLEVAKGSVELNGRKLSQAWLSRLALGAGGLGLSHPLADREGQLACLLVGIDDNVVAVQDLTIQDP